MCKDLFIVVTLTICFPLVCMHEFCRSSRNIQTEDSKMKCFFPYCLRCSVAKSSRVCLFVFVCTWYRGNYLVALKVYGTQILWQTSHKIQTMKFDLFIVNYSPSKFEQSMALFVLIRPIKYDLADKLSSFVALKVRRAWNSANISLKSQTYQKSMATDCRYGEEQISRTLN